MNLQKLNKNQTIGRIDMKNEYKAYLWKKNKSHIKYIESLSNHIYEYGLKFVALWENIDFFLGIREKYDHIEDAKSFINDCLADIEEDLYKVNVYKLKNYWQIQEIVQRAIKDEKEATSQLACRFMEYNSAFDLLFEVIAKALTGFTFATAYFEVTNREFPDEIETLGESHIEFCSYFIYENESNYNYKPYKLYTTNENILKYDTSSLVDIVSDITGANIYTYDIVIPDRESKIFEELRDEFIPKAKLVEFGDNPHIIYKDIKMAVNSEDLGKDIMICSLNLIIQDGKIWTISREREVSTEDVVQCLRYLLGKPIYVHEEKEQLSFGEQIEISWIEAE